jgi:hypothetical protein
VIEMSPEWVTNPEHGKPSGRFAGFSLWTDVFWDGIFSISDESYTAVTRSSLPRLWEQGIP